VGGTEGRAKATATLRGRKCYGGAKWRKSHNKRN